MRIEEIELYDEDIVDEILSHLGEYDRKNLEKVLKSLCETIITKDQQVDNLKERIDYAKPYLNRMLQMFNWDIDCNLTKEDSDKFWEKVKATNRYYSNFRHYGNV